MWGEGGWGLGEGTGERRGGTGRGREVVTGLTVMLRGREGDVIPTKQPIREREGVRGPREKGVFLVSLQQQYRTVSRIYLLNRKKERWGKKHKPGKGADHWSSFQLQGKTRSEASPLPSHAVSYQG